MRLAFIGGGIMSEAILAGVLHRGLAKSSEIVIGEPLEDRRTYLMETYKVTSIPENNQAIKGAELLILAVKPQDLRSVLAGLCCTLKSDQTVLSIVAGARLSTLIRGLSHSAVIRVMPNTPTRVSAGMSVWTAAPEVSTEALQATTNLLEAMGSQRYVDEEKYLDMATALSASGPAYVWLFLESLIDAGVTLGLPREFASMLATQTLLGSAKMATETGWTPTELRHQVTSPGGTTAEALLVLEDGAFRATIIQAVLAAYERSQELGADQE
jgi:pyrroline-5-carboxylate reductase